MPVPHALPVYLSEQDRLSLRRLVRAHSTPQVVARRAHILLRAADADQPTNLCIAQEVGCSHNTVAFWRRRFARQGLAGLQDAARSGRPRSFSPLPASPRP